MLAALTVLYRLSAFFATTNFTSLPNSLVQEEKA